MSKADSFYYTTHHLARDLFWNTGTFTFFLILGAALDSCLRDDLAKVVSALDQLSSGYLELGAGLAYLALASVSGLLAAEVIVVLTAFMKDCRFQTLRLFTFDGRYQLAADELNDFYEKIYDDSATDLTPDGTRYMDTLVRLTSFMRLHNPEGYVHVFRTYAIVGLYRQCIVYSTALLAWNLCQEPGWEALAFGILIVRSVFGLWFSIRYSVTREFAYLVSTQRWLETREPEKAAD